MKNFIKYMPFTIFSFVLLFTNVIGVCLLVWGPILYWKVTYLFTGITLVDLTVSDVHRLTVVTVLPVVFLGIGFHAGCRLAPENPAENPAVSKQDSASVVSLVSAIVFFVLLIYLFARLFRFLELKDAMAWLSNNKFYAMRRIVMEELHFKEFVMLYSILPTALALSYCRGNKRRLLLFGVEMILYVIINVYIFQKRPLIVGMLLIGIVIALNHLDGISSWRFRRVIAVVIGTAIALYCIYAIGITMNTIEKDGSQEYLLTTEKISLQQLERIAEVSDISIKPDKDMGQSGDPELFRSFELEQASLQVSPFQFAQLMAAVGLLNRTACSTITSVVAFPKIFDYYPLDLGPLNRLGLGSASNENLVTFMLMQPGTVNLGASPLPYHVTLYTQGGLWVAIVGSIITGFCLGFFWMLALRKQHMLNHAFGAWICVFASMLAINSGRFALFSSDGAAWPVLMIGCMSLCGWCVKMIQINLKRTGGK